jgi:tRNA (cmo5U34)-methyltransferase
VALGDERAQYGARCSGRRAGDIRTFEWELDIGRRIEKSTEPGSRNVLINSPLLDIGRGAGNYTLKLLQQLPLRAVTLIDLSRPMLDRAVERIHAAAPAVAVTAIQSDIREILLPDAAFDVAVAAATLHHLREDGERQQVFAALKGLDYSDHVFGYIEAEDTPRPLWWQLDLLARTGFREVDALHKNSCYAAFGAIK